MENMTVSASEVDRATRTSRWTDEDVRLVQRTVSLLEHVIATARAEILSAERRLSARTS